MGEEQRPWWTQPPTPSPRPSAPPAQPAGQYPAEGYPTEVHHTDAYPADSYADGYPEHAQDGAPGADGPAVEPRSARFRARVRNLRSNDEAPVPGPRSTGGRDEGSWKLPQFEPPPPHGAPHPQAPHPGTVAGPPPLPPVPPAPPVPGRPGDEPMVVDLRDLDDPHDPLAGTWDPAPGARDDVTLTPERYAGYPTGPDGRPAAGDATEQLPRVGEVGPADDALGVYGTPSRVAPGIPGISGDADPVGHLRGLPGGRRLPAGVSDVLSKVPGRDRLDKLPADRRILVIGGAALAVVLVVVLMRSVFGGGDDKAPPPAAAAATGQTAEAGTPKDFGKLSTDDAVKDLKKAGQETRGVTGAWRWTDKNGRNLLVTAQDKSGANRTLRVIHVARLDKTPKTLRVMTDPNLPNCRGGGGTAAFTKNSVQVRDLDKDSVTEVLVGWYARCGDAESDATVKLALLSNGDKYILRGEGVVGGEGGSQAPDPAAKSWPKPFLKAANADFKDLYF